MAPPILVTDPDDPRIDAFVGLRDHQLRRRREEPGGDMEGIFICEGDLVVERALAANYRLLAVLIDAQRSRPLPFIPADDVVVYRAGVPVLERITGFHLHRGMLACFARRPVLSPGDVLAGARRAVVVESVNNPTNLGIIVRCAAALGSDALLLDDTSCDPLYRRSSRVAMGAVFALPYARLGRFPQGLRTLKSHGFRLVALTPDPTARPIDRFSAAADERIGLLFGAEGPGLQAETLNFCDDLVRIPMDGGVDSLNVASAAAIALWCLNR